MRLILFFILALTASCSTIPYGEKTSTNSKGFWSKKVMKDAYRVYATYDRSSSPKRAEGYTEVQGFELCQKAGKKFYRVGEKQKQSGLKHWTLSKVVYCYKTKKRIALAVKVKEGTAEVDSIREDKKSKLIAKDEIISINNKAIKTREDIIRYFYTTRTTRKRLRIKVKRAGGIITISEKAIVLSDNLEAEDLKKVATEWGIPHANILGLEENKTK